MVLPNKENIMGIVGYVLLGLVVLGAVVIVAGRWLHSQQDGHNTFGKL